MNPAPTKLTAADLRHNLCIIFQPAIVDNPELLARIVAATGAEWAAAGVTERRIRNAAAGTVITAEQLAPLIEAVTA